MFMKSKKFTALFILLALCLAVTSSCSGESSGSAGDDDGGGVTNADGGEPGSESTAETTAEISVPVADMGGKEFNILVMDYAGYAPLNIMDISIEELTGEALNDAAYSRNMQISQTYNCKITTAVYPNNYSDMGIMKNAISAGDDAYDLCVVRAVDYLSMLTAGYLVNLNEVQNIDINNPWWDKATADAMSIGKKNYGLLGDYTTSIMNCVWNTYFNKKLIEDFGLEDPYALVKDGTWTIDKMYEMSRGVAADLNNDGVRDTNDRYGIAHIVDSGTSMLNSYGERYVSVGNDGLPYLSINTESAIAKFMHTVEIFADHDTCFNAHFRTNDPFNYEAQMFVNNQALFCLGGIYYGPEMRAMDEEFGILPYPKYDESQPEYYNATVVVALPFITIPQTNKDVENTGLFLEAYAAEGYKTIRPEFYDTLLQRKVARDDESAEMLDFIFGNLFIDIGAMYNFAGISGQFNTMNGNGDSNVASYLERNTERINLEIQKFVGVMTEE
jgi:ABC-type glycerol-3-phosphate transport system substrate-binding protein